MEIWKNFFTYDIYNNLIKREYFNNINNKSYTFKYNSKNQIIEEIYNGGLYKNNYDSKGKRMERTYYNDAGEPAEIYRYYYE